MSLRRFNVQGLTVLRVAFACGCIALGVDARTSSAAPGETTKSTTSKAPATAKAVPAKAVPAKAPTAKAAGAESSRGATSSLIGYQIGGGDSYFALSLKAASLPATSVAHDHVFLIDTSASQSGAHRKQALSVLEATIASLPKDDRIKLYGVDSEVRGLTKSFATPGSEEVKAGLAQLKKRIPLGATRLQSGIEAAMQALPEGRPGSVVFFGDGMSTGKLIDPAALRTLLGTMRDGRIAFHSFAVGPRTDLPLLGILAEHTGGVLLADELIDDKTRPAAKVGQTLAAAAVAPIFYPTKIQLTPAADRLLPGIVPPLRADRETVILGRGTIPASLKVAVEGAEGQKYEWTVKATPGQTGNAFLASLWQMAEQDQGLSVPLAGNEYLNLARQTFEDQISSLVALGRLAVSARDAKRAEEIAWAIRQSDPENAEARTILNAAQTVKLVKHDLGDKRLAMLQEAGEDAAPAAEEPTEEEMPAKDGDAPEAAAEEGAEPEEGAEEMPAKDGTEEAAEEMPAEEGAAAEGDATEEPAEEMPAEDAPATEEPAAEPATEEPATEADATEAPASEPNADEPNADEPDAAAPARPRRPAKVDDTEESAEIEEAAQNRRDLLAEERERMQLRAEALKREVAASVQAAQGVSREDPETALAELKRTQNTVEAALDIDVNVREQLRARLRKVQNEIASRREVLEQIRIRQMERQAQVQAQKNLVDQIVQRDQKLEQLIDRVRSLLTEGYLGNADAFEEGEAVARAAWELAPYSGTTAAAIFDAEAAGQLDKAMRLRSERADKFLAELHQVELSHVPFPDEPPVLWPPAEVWKALTERRKKWASVDLVRYNPIEERIRKALDSPTDVEFIETPLKDALLFLKDQHNINIWLDETKISDEGVATDQPVNLQLSGITLRSVLKLLLEPLQLTYVIDDEVMKITTTVAAGEKLYTRVYPVGDLVIPISQGQAGGLGQGLGGVGGIGGAGGQMGRGQFGAGGGFGGNGFGGGAGGGMGGGMFNVDDDEVIDNKAILERKKKLAN